MTADIACALCVPTTTAIPRTDEASAAVASLTAAMARGEEKAFRDFHSAYSGRLLRYAATVTRGDFTLAEEAVQIALVRIAKKVRSFPSDDAFWAWLATIARSCIIDCARRHSRHATLVDRLRQEPAVDSSPDEVERAFAEQLQSALATLDAADRELLTSKYHDGASMAELATRAGCTPKAMESRLARLRQTVRDLVLNRLRDDA